MSATASPSGDTRFLDLGDGYVITRIAAPRESVGRLLAESRLRATYGVTVVGIKRRGVGFTYATPDTTIASHDVLLVAGPRPCVERFAEAALTRR